MRQTTYKNDEVFDGFQNYSMKLFCMFYKVKKKNRGEL